MVCPNICPSYGNCEGDQCTCLPSFGGKDCIWKQCNATSSPSSCTCAHGFVGRSCNVCSTNNDCKYFQGASLEDSNNDPILCNPTPYVAERHHTYCGVSADLLDANFPEGVKSVTLTRIKKPNSIVASFWIDDEEQFICHASKCTNEIIELQDIWDCKQSRCKCFPTSTMCNGEKGIGIGGVLRQVTGYFKMSCPFIPTYPIHQDIKSLEHRDAVLQEPENRKCNVRMEKLEKILTEGFQFVNCQSGECGRLSTFNVTPNFRSLQWAPQDILFMSLLSSLLVGVLTLLVLCFIQRFRYRRLPLSPPQAPKEYAFANVSYTLGKRSVLTGLSGSFLPGTLTAIMGPSGAGKSSLLDILAHKPKRGHVTADFAWDGQPLPSSDKQFRHRVGFVDQEDVLLPWLSVFESLQFAADTRLPESLSKAQKHKTIEHVMDILNISHIRHSRIGGAGAFRGISGGERRRVSVAMELITSPSIIFLDEPTTGLDSHNAHKLMKCLANLAHQQNKTIICTIHQPRYDVYAMFDQILLMGHGMMLYQGTGTDASSFLESRGFPCPKSRHISDFMIDLTMQPRVIEALVGPLLFSSSSSSLFTASSDINQPCCGAFYSKFSRSFTFPKVSFNFPRFQLPSRGGKKNMKQSKPTTHSLYCVSYLTQFKCLLWRSIQCALRNKRLFFGHNLMAIGLGLFLGLLYKQKSKEISGFVNLMGLIVFLHLSISFSSFSALSNMASDRLLFMRERGNACYRPSTYFLSKLLTDLIPLRLLPTFFLGLFVYFMCGFQVTTILFSKFMLVLLLLSTSVTLVCMVISIVCADFAMANFVTSVTMLLFCLFSGIWINLTNMVPALSWLQYLSPCRWSSEALATSQLAFMTFITEYKGRMIPINGGLFLDVFFGLEIDQFSRNIYILITFDITLLILLGVLIVHKLKEIR